MQQIDRPPLVITRLRIPCACGLRLTGATYTFAGDILHISGVCLECGTQYAIFAPPRDQSMTTAEVSAIQIEVADLVDEVLGRRAARQAAEAGQDHEQEPAAQAPGEAPGEAQDAPRARAAG